MCVHDGKETVFGLDNTEYNDIMSSWWRGGKVAYKFCANPAVDDCGTQFSGAGSGHSA